MRFEASAKGYLAPCLALLLAAAGSHTQKPSGTPPPQPFPAAPTSSARPLPPSDLSRLWLVPARSAKTPIVPALKGFAKGVGLEAAGDHLGALPLVSAGGLSGTPLADYSIYFTARVQAGLERFPEARAAYARLRARRPSGYLAEAALLGEAEAATAQGDHAAAAKIYEELASQNAAAPDLVLLGLAKARLASGDRERAADTFMRLYYDFPLSASAVEAGDALDGLKDVPSVGEISNRYRRELGRAERLFAARRFTDARAAFQALRPLIAGDDYELVSLRLAECEFGLRRFRVARDAVQPFIDRAPYQAEALFFYLSAIRALGDDDEYVRLARRLVEGFGTTSWAEDTLNNLASHFIITDEDARADEVFRELQARFPRGRHAERAAWKIGWWAYKHGAYQETIKAFDDAAAGFPRSDYRPSYLYWAARAGEALEDRGAADAHYGLVLHDYRNSYYGRLAETRVGDRAAALLSAQRPAQPAGDSGVPAVPPTTPVIQALLSLELYDLALDELVYARRVWGGSAVIEATIGWTEYRLGDLRQGIAAMKRAYPQYLAAGGETLPPEILSVIFPLDYWALIRQHATARQLDPYLVAALVNQESAFDAAARSSANAIGLMQIIPSTGRRYVRVLRLGRFTTSMLTRPELSIRLGTAHLADLLKRFGSPHLALAGYNAGPHRVAQWLAERPGVEPEEFVDDIPFPETQAYVRKVLGTANDYRRLYGGSGATATEAGPGRPRPASPKASPPKPAATAAKPAKKT